MNLSIFSWKCLQGYIYSLVNLRYFLENVHKALWNYQICLENVHKTIANVHKAYIALWTYQICLENVHKTIIALWTYHSYKKIDKWPYTIFPENVHKAIFNFFQKMLQGELLIFSIACELIIFFLKIFTCELVKISWKC